MYYSREECLRAKNEADKAYAKYRTLYLKKEKMMSDNYRELQENIRQMTSKGNPMTAAQIAKALEPLGCPFDQYSIGLLGFYADRVNDKKFHGSHFKTSAPDLKRRSKEVTRYFAEVTPDGEIIPNTLKEKISKVNVYWVE